MNEELPAVDAVEEKKNGPAARALIAAKWLIMAGAAYYLWREGVLSSDHVRLSRRAAWAMPMAFVCLALSTLGMSVRFHGLFGGVGCPTTLMRQIRLNFSAVLAQQAGSEAGYDLFRIVGARAMGAKGADIFAVLIVDRLLGIVALVSVTLIGAAAFWTGSGAALYLAGAGVLLAPPVLYGVFRWIRGLAPESRLWAIPGSRFARSVAASALRFTGRGALLPALFLVSMASHLCVFAGLFFCGLALAEPTLSLSEAYLGGALASFTGALPLPLAGLGVGEAAFASVVSGMRGGGELVAFAAVFLINRLLILALGVVSWAWVTLTGNNIRREH